MLFCLMFLVEPFFVRFCRKQFAPSSPGCISEKERQGAVVINLNCILVHNWYIICQFLYLPVSKLVMRMAGDVQTTARNTLQQVPGTPL